MTRYATVVEVASDSSDATYRVYVNDDEGPIFCTCPGFRLRHGQVENRKPCKHMKRLGADERVVQQARTIARTVRAERTAKVSAVVGGDSRFRFIEVQEETDDGAWVSVTDLSRFNNLEVD